MLVNFKVALAVRKRSQIDFALQEGIDPTFLSQIINERRKADPALRARLAAALAVDESWLFSTYTPIPAPRSGEDCEPAGAMCAGQES